MEKFLWIIIIAAIVILWIVISWARRTFSNSKAYLELKPKLDRLENSIKEHELKVAKDRTDIELSALNAKKRLNEYSFKIKKEKETIEKLAKEEALKVKNEKEAVEQLAKEKYRGFPWLADAYAEYFSLYDLRREKYLENKKMPALNSAATVREIKGEKKYC